MFRRTTATAPMHDKSRGLLAHPRGGAIVRSTFRAAFAFLACVEQGAALLLANVDLAITRCALVVGHARLADPATTRGKRGFRIWWWRWRCGCFAAATAAIV